MPANGLQASLCVYGGKGSHSHLGTLYVVRHTYNFLSVISAERVLVIDGRHGVVVGYVRTADSERDKAFFEGGLLPR